MANVTTNFNVSPYYDDYDEDKSFLRVLFRPGFAVQGRELTQVQSILQNQVESFGKYAFKQGELVIPGEVGLNTKLDYVKLSSVSEVAVNDGNNNIVYKKYDISQLVGEELLGLTSGVKGRIVSTKLATESTADTLFVNYVNSGSSNTETTFRQGETLEVVDGVNTPLLVVGTDGSVLPTSIKITDPDSGEVTSLESPAMGFGSAVKVEEGIYFVNGYFVRCDSELLVIDEYFDLKQRVQSQKENFENLSKKFKEMRSLAIDYKGGKDKEISNLNSELDKFKKMVEESQGIYEKMLEKTTQSLEEIIKNSENSSKVQ